MFRLSLDIIWSHSLALKTQSQALCLIEPTTQISYRSNINVQIIFKCKF